MIRKGEEGSAVLEAVMILPVLFVLFFAIFWGGRLMYAWAGVNYAAMSAAMDTARRGEFSAEARAAAAEHLRQWTPGGKALAVDAAATAPYENPGAIVVWGPPPGQKFQRGNSITVGVVYPFKVDSPLLALVGRAAFGGDVVYLKASATARSEVFIE